MSFFQRLRRNRLTPAWRFQADATLWRLELAPGGKIVGEVRDSERRQASFFCLEDHSGAVRWSGVRLNEAWWVGIERIVDDVVLLHEYEKPDLPQHGHLHALDLSGGSELWEHQRGSYWFAAKGSLYVLVQGVEGQKVVELNLRTGIPVRELDPGAEEIRLLQAESPSDADAEEILLPESFDATVHGKEVAGVVERSIGAREVGGEVGIIRYRNLLVLGWHEASGVSGDGRPRYSNKLLVWESPEEWMIYDDVLVGDVSSTVKDTFFVARGMLFYVKEYRALVAVKLATETDQR